MAFEWYLAFVVNTSGTNVIKKKKKTGIKDN